MKLVKSSLKEGRWLRLSESTCLTSDCREIVAEAEPAVSIGRSEDA